MAAATIVIIRRDSLLGRGHWTQPRRREAENLWRIEIQLPKVVIFTPCVPMARKSTLMCIMNTEQRRDRLYLLNCECVPAASSPRRVEIEGAFVWAAVLAASESAAIDAVKRALSNVEFILKRIEEVQFYGAADRDNIPVELRSIAESAKKTAGEPSFDEFLEYERSDDDLWTS